MIVTVGSTKGGVGKTTIALQLALARTLAGSSVLLVDGDRQGSALTAVSMRSEAARSPGLACVHYPDERVLRAQVQQQTPRYDQGSRMSLAGDDSEHVVALQESTHVAESNILRARPGTAAAGPAAAVGGQEQRGARRGGAEALSLVTDTRKDHF